MNSAPLTSGNYNFSADPLRQHYLDEATSHPGAPQSAGTNADGSTTSTWQQSPGNPWSPTVATTTQSSPGTPGQSASGASGASASASPSDSISRGTPAAASRGSSDGNCGCDSDNGNGTSGAMSAEEMQKLAKLLIVLEKLMGQNGSESCDSAPSCAPQASPRTNPQPSSNCGPTSGSSTPQSGPPSSGSTAAATSPGIPPTSSSTQQASAGALVPVIPGFGINGSPIAWGDPKTAAALNDERGGGHTKGTLSY